MADDVPNFEFSEEQLAAIREELSIADVPPDGIEDVVIPPVKKRRGRPPKNRAVEAEEPTSPLPPAPLSKRDEREVAVRLTSMMLGGTGLAAQVKPYLQMSEEEAKAIADPLSSYLVRNADTIGVAKQVLENYDLLAITLGVMAYVVRVYRERSDELREQQQAEPTFSDRVAQLTEAPNNGSAERGANVVSTPYGEGGWPSS